MTAGLSTRHVAPRFSRLAPFTGIPAPRPAPSPYGVDRAAPADTAAPAAAPAAVLPDAPVEDEPDSRVLIDTLVAGAVGGDGRARDELLALIHPLVLKYCRARLGRQESLMGSADDVAQDVCMAVVSALPTYQLKGLSFRAFVYGIAAHKVTDAFRAIGRNRAEQDPAQPAQRAVLGHPHSPRRGTHRLGRLLRRQAHRQPQHEHLPLARGELVQQVAQPLGELGGEQPLLRPFGEDRRVGQLGDGVGPVAPDGPERVGDLVRGDAVDERSERQALDLVVRQGADHREADVLRDVIGRADHAFAAPEPAPAVALHQWMDLGQEAVARLLVTCYGRRDQTLQDGCHAREIVGSVGGDFFSDGSVHSTHTVI